MVINQRLSTVTSEKLHHILGIAFFYLINNSLLPIDKSHCKQLWKMNVSTILLCHENPLHPEEKLSVTAEIFIFIKITCNPLHIDVVIN